MANCRSCGAEIIWRITEKGKRIPLDAQPIKTPGLFYEAGGTDHVHSAPELYLTHFASCPNADQHRKERGE